MFEIAQGVPTINLAWCPVDITTATNLYVGQLVQKSTGAMSGVGPLAAASGVSDLGGDQQIFGIVVGTNNYPMTTLFNATYGQYISGVAAQAGQKAIQKMGGGAPMFPANDPAPRVLVALIDETTWIKGKICYSTYGTAPTLLTVTTGDTTGAGCTTNASDCTSVANLATMYFRTGANAGIYRTVKSASSTTHTFDMYFPYPIAVGDTCVMVPFVQGTSYANINETAGYLGMCLRSDKTAATNYFGIFVKEMDLAEAGKETVTFRFNSAAFGGIR